MRIPSIVPMLLLAFSLAGQNAPCHIYDLTAKVVDCANGQFYATLNFQHQNTGNDGYKVTVSNGASFGPFQYTQVPVTVGPFAANNSTNYSFVVRDVAHPDCADDFGLGPVSCSSTAPCKIYDFVAKTGDCTSDSTYQLTLNFKVQNSSNDKFSLWANNKLIGSYTLSQLPLTINNCPSVGTGGYAKVCMNDNPDCCGIVQFVAPDCKGQLPCEIYDITVKTGDCNADGTYKLDLNFKVANATNGLFNVWAANGKLLGTFSLDKLPVSLAFPWGGGPVDVIKVCINDNANCCKTKEFPAPACFNPCEIRNITVETGGCSSDSTYKLLVNFQVPASADSFDVWAGNGKYLGRFSKTNLPVGFGNFPWGGGTIDAVKVCLVNGCCRTKEFNAPECIAPACGISNLKVEVGDCVNPKIYKVTLNFTATTTDPSIGGKFEVWADNGTSLGIFGLNQLPLGLYVPWNGDKKDALKVCLLDATGKPTCCEIITFDAPPCAGVSCGIYNLTVKPGACHDDGTYELTVNFQTPASSLDKFGVWAGNGKFLGFFTLADLPLTLKNFPWGGTSLDKVVICFGNTCCETKEFNAPDCVNTSCGIANLSAVPGDCNPDGTFQLKINFEMLTVPPGPTPFEVFASNGKSLGTYTTANLPLLIQNFPWNGQSVDAVKICIGGNTTNTYCCRVVEFKAPDCTGAPCNIFNLKVETGACNDDGSYQMTINFTTTSAAGSVEVFSSNGKSLGVFPLSALPIHIKNFPHNGADVDVVAICLSTTPGTAPCCVKKEFKTPDCGTNPCGLSALSVQTGDCNADGTYHLWVKFQVTNPTNTTQFAVWANGTSLGTFPLSALPLHIEHFPTDGGPNDVIKVCLVTPLTVLCCETLEFAVPDCAYGPCEIYDLVADPGGCTSDSTYKLTINFKVKNPGTATKFMVGTVGKILGVYDLSALPLTIPNFPSDGGPNDLVKVCLVAANSTGSSTCCAVKEFKVPDCLAKPCDIVGLKVVTGKCNPATTPNGPLSYEVWINFGVNNPPAGATHFGVWANGQLLGFYPLTQLPLYIPNFPSNGGPNDVVKVCLSNTGVLGCCETLEFPVPDCIPGGLPCEIYDLKVETGACNDDGTYQAWVIFKVQNPGSSTQFGVWANGKYLGAFPLSNLPLKIDHFPTDGGLNDVVKVCLLPANPASTVPTCCAVKEFPVPKCIAPCDIFDLSVKTGDCNSNGTYHVWVNFGVKNAPATGFFGVWANGKYLGNYPLSALPLHIEEFPTDGGPNDVIKVCMLTPTTASAANLLCCETLEFPVPICGSPCEIYDMTVQTGDCNPDGSYKIVLNFKVQNPGNDFFEAWSGTGKYLGYFKLSQLPLTIPNFPASGNTVDVIKVCINDNPNCCRKLEFKAPTCPSPCHIYDMTVQTGDCNQDGTYHLWVNFKVNSTSATAVFGVWANGKLMGTYPLSALPLHIEHFPTDGGPNDVVKVCLMTPGSTNTLCCETKEFPVPICTTPCDIYDLKVETGDCNADGTYRAWVNFKATTINSAAMFSVWANGKLMGTYPLSALPLLIEHFPTDGGPNDVVKVCLVTPGTTTTLCCETLEFPVPSCLGSDCHIYDMVVAHTPCLCGQFFALVSFKFDKVGSGGFDIVGNGVNYGNFPYNQQQPIILGPLKGDNQIKYEFVVRDHLHPDCQDVVELGKVDCTGQFQFNSKTASLGKLALSPNPTSNWLSVAAVTGAGAAVGQATIEIRQPDGQLIRTLVVEDASNFQLEVGELPAGMYRLSVQTAATRLEGTFAKQ